MAKYTYEDTIYTNYKLIVKDGEPIGVVSNPNDSSRRVLMKGDTVKVSGDSIGYIGPGLYSPGIGVIDEILRDDTDHWFHVKMENGDSGSCKGSRLEKLDEDRWNEIMSTSFEPTFFDYCFYIVRGGKTIGVLLNKGCCNEYRLMKGDVVQVVGDSHGVITPGIKHPGIGIIDKIYHDDTDHWFRVTMIDTGESGYCKSGRLKKI